MSSKQSRVKTIFLAALDQPTPAERTAFVDQACTGNVGLQQRIEQLLQAHDEPNRLLDRWDRSDTGIGPTPTELLDLDEAIEHLVREDHAAKVVKLHLYAGLTIEEIAETLGLSRAGAQREWWYARAWLICALQAQSCLPDPESFRDP
jgi:hypothetical protein